jgi:hypothetical protein
MKHRELTQQQKAIEDAIRFAASIDEGSPERAMIARHICVLVSGFVENVIRVYLTEFSRLSKPKAQVENYVEASVDRFQNPEFDKILDITGRFSSTWRRELEKLDESIKSAITSIVSNRHLIAHGRHSGVSLAQASEYARRAYEFEHHFKKICK